MLSLHSTIAQAIVLYFAILGAWGLVLALRRQRELSPAFRSAMALGVVVAIVQTVVGVVLLVTVGQPRDDLHFLYGASVILTFPLVGSYIADKKVSRPLVYGLASLFIAGLAIRAMTTGA